MPHVGMLVSTTSFDIQRQVLVYSSDGALDDVDCDCVLCLYVDIFALGGTALQMQSSLVSESYLGG